MKTFTLNSDDLTSCIEMACDGINVHLGDQSKMDVIHKIMYAIAETAQNNPRVCAQLESTQMHRYTLALCHQNK